MFELSKRLLSCASLVSSKNIVDVGTDHAKLPIWLLKNNIINDSIACDITDFSINRSINNVKKYKLQDKIKVVFSDGLSNIDQNYSDTIVIAGLGGTTISEILRKCPWTNKKNKNFILQPTKSDSDLRIFLANSGFSIDSELVVNDSKFSYSTILSKFTGSTYKFDDLYPFVGKIHPCKESCNYIKKHIRYIEKILKGAIINDNIELINKTEKVYTGLCNFLSDCRK